MENSQANALSSDAIIECNSSKSAKTVPIKQKWMIVEDVQLKLLVELYGENWVTISSKFPNRTRKQWYVIILNKFN